MKREAKKPVKIIVTGSRGKSSIVRLIHAALIACGSMAYGRITGVLPRELTPSGEVPILRSSGGNVGEMKWWLDSVCPAAEAIVMENSAVNPELQSLAWKWAVPDLTVMSNIYPDHQEAWGPGEEDAFEALSEGIRPGSAVVLGPGLGRKTFLVESLRAMGCTLFPVPAGGNGDFRKDNLATALEACRFLELDMERSERAMKGLHGDIADFRVVEVSGEKLAFAFSANDISSTVHLFDLLDWDISETVFLYNHRKDRYGRLGSFKEWILGNPWSSVCIIGDRPLSPWTWRYFVKCGNLAELLPFQGGSGRIFGCGNVAGLPLDFILGRKD